MTNNDPDAIPVERVQTGFRMEKKTLKVLKATAEYLDMTLSELMESIVLHAFEGHGADAFREGTLKQIAQFKVIYGMNYDTHASHHFVEPDSEPRVEAQQPAEV